MTISKWQLIFIVDYRWFAEFKPRNPLTSEQVQYLRDVGSHTRDMIRSTQDQVKDIEVCLAVCMGRALYPCSH